MIGLLSTGMRTSKLAATDSVEMENHLLTSDFTSEHELLAQCQCLINEIMLCQRRRRRNNIDQTLGQCVVFAGVRGLMLNVIHIRR